MAEKKFTDQHEWIILDGDVATIGITDYAQAQLGDVVFVELPENGKALAKGDEGAVVESVKAAAEVYAPVDGTVIEVNDGLDTDPGKVNTDAETDGWFFKLSITDAGQLDDLMDEAAYTTFIQGLD